MSKQVNHPSHYNAGKIEVIEFIEDQKLNYHRGNCVKYICRAGKKDITKEIEDLEKAAWYVLREIEVKKAARDGRTIAHPNDMNPRDEIEAEEHLADELWLLPDECRHTSVSSETRTCVQCGTVFG